MISAWWLLLAIPSSIVIGYILCGILVTGAQSDKCIKCVCSKEKSK